MDLILDFDRVFGLDLNQVPERYDIGAQNNDALQRREALRQRAAYRDADALRSQMVEGGMVVQDTAVATLVRPQTQLELQEARWPSVSASREVRSVLDEPDLHDFTFLVNAYDYVDDVRPMRRGGAAAHRRSVG